VEEEAQLARGFNPPEQNRLWRDVLLPRSVIPLYWLYKAALLPSFVLGKKPKAIESVAIESGKVGWTHVYFEELEGSAQDYFGAEHVMRQVIDRDAAYFPQFRANQLKQNPSLVILDVRTPTQSWSSSLVETFRMTHLLLGRGITPLVVLTDAYYRRHRWQAAVLTAYRGSVVTFSAKEIVRKIFPHDRIAGALFMPISQKRLIWLKEQKAQRRLMDAPIKITFIGSMYSPREEFLELVKNRLAKEGIALEINGDKAGTSNDQYWAKLVNSDIILTTTLQGPQRGYMDWVWVRQAVFRYSETLAAGTALVAGKVDGGFAYFENGRDFLEFDNVEECVEALLRLAKDPESLAWISFQGHEKIDEYVSTGKFWQDVLPSIALKATPISEE
jgi:hypothetical protein